MKWRTLETPHIEQGFKLNQENLFKKNVNSNSKMLKKEL